MNELEEVIRHKNVQLEKLQYLINEKNKDFLNVDDENEGSNHVDKFLTKQNKENIEGDETRLVAQTAHKTIKAMQELLSNKNDQIAKKDDIILNLKEDLIRNQTQHNVIVHKLNEQIEFDHNSTMKKLKYILENANINLNAKVTKSQLSLMTLNDIEILIEEKDAAIKTLVFELKAVKEENEINYLKINDLNKRVAELVSNLDESNLRVQNLAQNEEIEKLKLILREKAQLIEGEKENIKILKDKFAQKLEDRSNLEDKLFKQSVHVPERLIDNSEKTIMYNKIQSLRNKNKKLQIEIEKLHKVIEEQKKIVEDFRPKHDSLKQENRNFLTMQVNDTKLISRLKKEKADLTENGKKLIDENENLKKLLNAANNALNISNSNNIVNTSENNIINNKDSANANNNNNNNSDNHKLASKRAFSLNRRKEVKKDQSIESASKNNITNSNKMVSTSKDLKNIVSTAEDSKELIFKKFVNISLKKNINMQRHLQRYDLSKSGTITKQDFIKAIFELKLGFIENEINKLVDYCSFNDGFIDISAFISFMSACEPTYDLIIKEQSKIFIY